MADDPAMVNAMIAQNPAMRQAMEVSIELVLLAGRWVGSWLGRWVGGLVGKERREVVSPALQLSSSSGFQAMWDFSGTGAS